ncbi:methyltransferase [Leisingera caerulea]|uniref:Methyltransferase n=1 Tax=Leisingera caerulea TaxID=506591 RepID=A0ABY5WYR6_LEICA|nr:methyltransferase [Leisingera caerulea]UWQ59170.1 methyltransferase [Leisingera caerulea]
MSGFREDELTRNGFLDARVQLWQPARGYRAGVDPVLLAAAVPARAGEAVLELGCGAGQALLCLGARVPGLALAGVELQAPYADLARRNAAANGQAIDVHEADLSALPEALKQRQFHHVIANPPYYKAGAHSQARDDGRKVALGEGTPLADWIAVAARRLVPKGRLHMIQRADRLPDMLAACDGVLGSLEVLPLAPRQGRAAELVILRARKGGRAGFRLHAPLILHEGDRHERDGESYRPEIRAILRDGAALPWPA